MADPSRPPLIELSDVCVVLGRRAVLVGIRWQLAPGEHWLVSGPNGAGKTTLLRIIRGDQPILHGSGRRTYRLNDTDEDPLRVAKARIGYLAPEFHERLLRMELPLTARELIAGGVHGTFYLPAEPPRDERERVVRLAERLALTNILDEPINELSFGQFRRALLARALAPQPRVLVLDEFAHGIDRQSRRLISEALAAAVADGTSLVVATHRREELPEAITHELQLSAGRVSHAGPLAEPAKSVRATHASNGSAADRNGGGALLLRLENVDVFAERRPVLHGITWEIRRHEHWVIRGPNGAGKTTLAKLLYGRLRAAYGGKVERFGGQE
ncbi:MAG: ATP-binding cassette domain-containing protein, partial [Candidatus Eremiobacteraeota bacterium]|nr:ATP-binding cassette domain-containing protein [Candidatus Eremiobacteraeota bacterium]